MENRLAVKAIVTETGLTYCARCPEYIKRNPESCKVKKDYIYSELRLENGQICDCASCDQVWNASKGAWVSEFGIEQSANPHFASEIEESTIAQFSGRLPIPATATEQPAEVKKVALNLIEDRSCWNCAHNDFCALYKGFTGALANAPILNNYYPNSAIEQLNFSHVAMVTANACTRFTKIQ